MSIVIPTKFFINTLGIARAQAKIVYDTYEISFCYGSLWVEKNDDKYFQCQLDKVLVNHHLDNDINYQERRSNVLGIIRSFSRNQFNYMNIFFDFDAKTLKKGKYRVGCDEEPSRWYLFQHEGWENVVHFDSESDLIEHYDALTECCGVLSKSEIEQLLI